MPPHRFLTGTMSPMLRNMPPLSSSSPSPSESDTLRESTPSDSTCLELSNDNVVLEDAITYQGHCKRDKKVSFHAVTLVIDPGLEYKSSHLSSSEESTFLQTAFSSYHNKFDEVAEDLSNANTFSPHKTGEVYKPRSSAGFRILRFLVADGASAQTFECPAMLESSISTLFPPLISISMTHPGFLLAHAGPSTMLPSSSQHRASLSGMFANQDISQGQCIFAERPCLVTFYSILDGKHQRDLAKLFDSLNPGLIDEAISLLCPHESEDFVRYEQIMRCYSLAIRLSPPRTKGNEEAPKHRGLFLKSSRIRHRYFKDFMFSINI